MTRDGVAAAIEKAEAFVVLATKVAAQKDDVFICGTKLTGQMRRASLDLTRALADMRKP
jgi:hypothetical protein